MNERRGVLEVEYVYQSDKGKVRKINEDAVAVFDHSKEYILAVVADGMGGHQAGDVASQLTIDNLYHKWEELEYPLDRDNVENWLRDAIRAVNNIVYEKANTDSNYFGMGTTVVVAFCTKEFISIAHIGDSRAYVMNKKAWKQVTSDHSLVAELVRKGQLSEEDADHHPKRNVILKALGTELDLEPDIYSSNWNEVERLLICSDGLTNKISDQELHDIVSSSPLDSLTQTLIDKANTRGGEDNITLAILEYQPTVGESPC